MSDVHVHTLYIIIYMYPQQPNELLSPTYVLEKQEGNCFDMACLLCSLLLGVGYDAYCVCGYASRHMTELDQLDQMCPLLKKEEEVINCTLSNTMYNVLHKCLGFGKKKFGTRNYLCDQVTCD